MTDFIAASLRMNIGGVWVNIRYGYAERIGQQMIDWERKQTRLRKEADDREANSTRGDSASAE